MHRTVSKEGKRLKSAWVVPGSVWHISSWLVILCYKCPKPKFCPTFSDCHFLLMIGAAWLPPPCLLPVSSFLPI